LSTLIKTGYRRDIDGLRAVAILPVILYHVGVGCPGGYVGVDVFFVISGYLISALILKEIEEHRFSLTNFWERRIRRIFPAVTAMVAGVVIAGWIILEPDYYAPFGNSVMAQAHCCLIRTH
jgi:peptidoglycan/LPS O-acetylase OafA/YrhL